MEESRELILKMLAEKAGIKQAVNDHSTKGFLQVREILKKLADEMPPLPWNIR